MTIRDLPPGIQILNSTFDQLRSERAFANDAELALFLHISKKTLSFLRKGRMNRGALVVTAVLTGDHSLLPPVD